jgi:hypothetical protein
LIEPCVVAAPDMMLFLVRAITTVAASNGTAAKLCEIVVEIVV